MAGKAKEWTAAQEAKFKRLVGQGLSADEISKRLTKDGVPSASRSSVDAKRRALIGSQRASAKATRPASRPKAGGKSKPATPVRLVPTPDKVAPPSASDLDELADIPDDPSQLDGATPHELDMWIARANATYERALSAENLSVQVASIGKAKELLDAKRRSTPPTPPDPNDQPDMIRLAEEIPARLLKAIDLVTEES